MTIKRFLLGIGLGAGAGFLVWAIVILIGIWKGWPIPVIIGTGVGVLTNILVWLVPNPRKIKRYLSAFWEACKMSPNERILYQQLAKVYQDQQSMPHRYIYLADDSINVGSWIDQSPNTVEVRFFLISCLLDDTPVEACEILLTYIGYEAPQGFPIRYITNLPRLTRSDKHSYIISVTDMKMQQFVEEARKKNNAIGFSIDVYLRIRGKMDIIQHR